MREREKLKQTGETERKEKKDMFPIYICNGRMRNKRCRDRQREKKREGETEREREREIMLSTSELDITTL